MSKRYNDGSHYENHERAAEMHDLAAHNHRSASEHSQMDRLSGHEHSRLALEHSQTAHLATVAATVGNGVTAFGHTEIAVLAHRLWEARGCPEGSAELDWHSATAQLRSKSEVPRQ
jgi:hypothetical protein